MNKPDMGSASGAFLFAIFLVVCVPALQREEKDDNVVIGFYSESLCPDCIALSNGPLTDAFNEVCIK